MNLAKYTPGPWAVRKGLGGGRYWHITSDAVDGLAVAKSADDARLIAAAPLLAKMANNFTVMVERLIRADLPDGVDRATTGQVAEAMFELRELIDQASGRLESADDTPHE